jgi:hypothetical protein
MCRSHELTAGPCCLINVSVTPMAMSLNWRIPSDADLHGRRWPGESEYVFYHGATGDTHRLSELAGLVIELILEGK